MIGVEKFNFMFEIDISRNYPQNILGVMSGDFWGCVQKTPRRSTG